jgi:hypothetical protein
MKTLTAGRATWKEAKGGATMRKDMIDRAALPQTSLKMRTEETTEDTLSRGQGKRGVMEGVDLFKAVRNAILNLGQGGVEEGGEMLIKIII